MKYWTQIFRGYVDDPRNTDNAWMETVAIHYHADGTEIDNCRFHAGSDAKQVSWMEISNRLNLYASHKHFIKLAAERLQAHWE